MPYFFRASGAVPDQPQHPPCWTVGALWAWAVHLCLRLKLNLPCSWRLSVVPGQSWSSETEMSVPQVLCGIFELQLWAISGDRGRCDGEIGSLRGCIIPNSFESFLTSFRENAVVRVEPSDMTQRHPHWTTRSIKAPHEGGAESGWTQRKHYPHFLPKYCFEHLLFQTNASDCNILG